MNVKARYRSHRDFDSLSSPYSYIIIYMYIIIYIYPIISIVRHSPEFSKAKSISVKAESRAESSDSDDEPQAILKRYQLPWPITDGQSMKYKYIYNIYILIYISFLLYIILYIYILCIILYIYT